VCGANDEDRNAVGGKLLYDEAVEDYRTALGLAPEHQEALLRLACRYDLAGDETAAIDCYKQMALQSTVHVNALLNLAVLYEDEGELDRAGECVQKVLQFHPNHERALLFEKDIESSKDRFITRILPRCTPPPLY